MKAHSMWIVTGWTSIKRAKRRPNDLTPSWGNHRTERLLIAAISITEAIGLFEEAAKSWHSLKDGDEIRTGVSAAREFYSEGHSSVVYVK